MLHVFKTRRWETLAWVGVMALVLGLFGTGRIAPVDRAALHAVRSVTDAAWRTGQGAAVHWRCAWVPAGLARSTPPGARHSFIRAASGTATVFDFACIVIP